MGMDLITSSEFGFYCCCGLMAYHTWVLLLLWAHGIPYSPPVANARSMLRQCTVAGEKHRFKVSLREGAKEHFVARVCSLLVIDIQNPGSL